MLLSSLWFFYNTTADALPIGFGRTQGDLNYNEIISDDFRLYFDKRTPKEARSIFNALHAIKPPLENLLGVKRDKTLPVILSATTSMPSFANFITDAIELQTLGTGDRDLAWHELTHSLMYMHFRNFLGPTGAIVHLPWLPAWMIEGLAEASSQSLGSNWQAGIERHLALENRWPSYVKLHNLYRSNFSDLGYAISGAFVRYILSTCGAAGLPKLLEDFYDYTMPWWWPWSLVPFNGFLPFDAALVNYCGKNGEELYEDYKKAATEHWLKQDLGTRLTWNRSTATLDINQPTTKHNHHLAGQNISFSNDRAFSFDGQDLFVTQKKQGQLEFAKILFDRNPPKGSSRTQKVLNLQEGTSKVTRSGHLYIFAKTSTGNDLETSTQLSYAIQSENSQELFPFLERSGSITHLFISRNYLIWAERNLSRTSLCKMPLKAISLIKDDKAKVISCPLSYEFPETMSIVGQTLSNYNKGYAFTDALWLRVTRQTLVGDAHHLYSWLPQNDALYELPINEGGKPLSATNLKQQTFVLVAGRSQHTIRTLGPKGDCLKEIPISNTGGKIYGFFDGSLAITSLEDSYHKIYRLDPSTLPSRPCQYIGQPESSLQYLLRHPAASFDKALEATSIWSKPKKSQMLSLQKALYEAPALDQIKTKNAEIKPSKWRGRPVFAFPWIGVDAEGYQIGTLAVPLMDEMQNETVRLSALYGTNSQYPSVSLGIDSTRFIPRLSLDIFKRQVWNGVYDGYIYYYDEVGASFSSRYDFPAQRLRLSLGLASSKLRPLLGDSAIWEKLNKGEINEINLSLQQHIPLSAGIVSYNLSSNIVPAIINPNFDYLKLNLGLSFNKSIRILGMNSTQTYGLKYAETRGKKVRLLREVYRPLKTFVPGTGGGLNEINKTLYGPGYLTSAIYGDTQSRFNFSWTFPLVSDLETLIHIIYLERLDFTAFFNYGAAWESNSAPPRWDGFVKAHGYNLDLQADVKGVTLNLGLGIGQVFEQDFEIYFLFGFDTLIN